MAEQLLTTRRALLAGLAAAPLAALPAVGTDTVVLNQDEAFKQALADFKQAVRDRWPEKKITFSTTWDEDGDTTTFRGVMAVEVFPVFS